jgi:hypothetical protein
MSAIRYYAEWEDHSGGLTNELRRFNLTKIDYHKVRSAITFLYCSNASDYRYSVAHKQPLGYYYRYTNTQCMQTEQDIVCM